jgi:hypothetical protein
VSANRKVAELIEIPENPPESGFTDEQWSEIMTSIWVQWWRVYYRTHRDEIDESLQNFTNKFSRNWENTWRH